MLSLNVPKCKCVLFRAFTIFLLEFMLKYRDKLKKFLLSERAVVFFTLATVHAWDAIVKTPSELLRIIQILLIIFFQFSVKSTRLLSQWIQTYCFYHTPHCFTVLTTLSCYSTPPPFLYGVSCFCSSSFPGYVSICHLLGLSLVALAASFPATVNHSTPPESWRESSSPSGSPYNVGETLHRGVAPEGDLHLAWTFHPVAHV